jgi:two-component system NtrC family response regulator
MLIANAFLQRSDKQHRRTLRFGSSALEAIIHYAWPGNIRELENAVARGVLMARTKFIEARDLGIEVKNDRDLASLREARNRAERNALVDALAKTRGNITQGARLLAVSRPTLHGLIAKYQVNARNFR